MKPDIVHVHGTLTPQFLYAAKKARSQGKKTLATHHIGLINQQHHGQKTWILLRKWLIHNSFPFICDKVISLSRHGRRSFISRSKVDVSHGIGKLDAKELGSKELNKLVRQNIINLKPGAKPSEVKRFLIYPARFSRQKNQLALVEAFAEFTREEKNGLKLLLVGDAAEKAYAATVSVRIEQLGMSDRIYMLKAIQHAVLLRMMKKADLLISPSLNEGLGRTCLEALQLGV
ncbi:glycosyltransferase family 4 protein, partial [Candidatus Woesearchaeota archaeon]|nr:glycosyltransferase family 4 protein [Candidatus Woesearchaeota archaeon]